MAKVTGLEGVIAAETDISLVDGENGFLVYRGHWAKDLAISKSFEEVCHLLWYGRLPNGEELAALRSKLIEQRELPTQMRQLMDVLPLSLPMMSVLQTVIASIDYAWPPTVEQAISLTARMPALIAYRYRQQTGRAFVEPDADLAHAANYLYMLTGQRPEEAHSKALTAYLILGMEHGMNASTFAGRVVLSTQSDMASAVSGAIGAMKGPLHGGAPSEVTAMLEDIGTKANAGPWLRAKLEQGERLMGFGHRVYKTRDPRAEALRLVTSGLTGQDPWFDLAIHVEEMAISLLEEYKPGRRLYTNVEFFAASIMRAIQLPSDLFTPTFTAARVVGWTAHLLEQASINRIFRPQSLYTGAQPESQ